MKLVRSPSRSSAATPWPAQFRPWPSIDEPEFGIVLGRSLLACRWP
jgi:hypothetical protein